MVRNMDDYTGTRENKTRDDAREFDGFVQDLLRLLPQDLERSRQDLEKLARAVLNAALARMNLVTREEFDVQAELLANTRRALDELEGKITALENADSGQPRQ